MIRLAVLFLLAVAAPLQAKQSLGVFGDWGAFRDALRSEGGPRCYAIAMPAPSRLQRDHEPYATIASWPRRNIRGQVHLRLSRTIRATAAITLLVSGKSFALSGSGADAWAQDRGGDAAIVAAMRSAGSMTVSSTDTSGRRFSNTYTLGGASSAMDAATIACARR